MKPFYKLFSNSGTSAGARKGWESRKVGEWVVHPKTGKRGLITHVYHDNENSDGKLVQVDYGARGDGLYGGINQANHREAHLKLSRDQESKWAAKPNE